MPNDFTPTSTHRLMMRRLINDIGFLSRDLPENRHLELMKFVSRGLHQVVDQARKDMATDARNIIANLDLPTSQD